MTSLDRYEGRGTGMSSTACELVFVPRPFFILASTEGSICRSNVRPISDGRSPRTTKLEFPPGCVRGMHASGRLSQSPLTPTAPAMSQRNVSFQGV